VPLEMAEPLFFLTELNASEETGYIHRVSKSSRQAGRRTDGWVGEVEVYN